MKKHNFFLIVTILIVSVVNAQIKLPTKTQTAVQSNTTIKTIQPVPVSTTTNRTTTTVMSSQGTTSTINPTISIAMGGGKKMRVELVRDIRSWSNANENDKYKTSDISSAPATDSKPGWNCTNKNVILTAESVSFMPAMQNSTNITAGSIYTFEDFYTGAYNEITQMRNPMTIYTDNIRSGGPITQVVNEPKGSSITAALGAIVAPFTNDKGSARLIYRTFSSKSDLDFKLKVTAGGMYGAFSADAEYSLNKNEEKVYLTFDVYKPMFKVIAERPSNGFFSDPVMEQSNPNMIYVKEVVYGTRVLVNLEIVVTSQEDLAKIKASYGVGDTTKKSFSASMDLLSKLKSARQTVNAYITGGPQDMTLLNKDKLEEEITKLVERCNYGTADPISYTLADMSGRVIGIRSTTDQFPVRECIPANTPYYLDMAKLTITCGGDNKEYPSQFAARVYRHAPYNVSDPDVLLYYSVGNSEEIKSGESQTLKLEAQTYNGGKADFDIDFFKRGGRIEIYYAPNFPLDAWEIGSMKLYLTFRDASGVAIEKVVWFRSINKKLGAELPVLVCEFDGNFGEVSSQLYPATNK